MGDELLTFLVVKGGSEASAFGKPPARQGLGNRRGSSEPRRVSTHTGSGTWTPTGTGVVPGVVADLVEHRGFRCTSPVVLELLFCLRPYVAPEHTGWSGRDRGGGVLEVTNPRSCGGEPAR